MLINYYEHGSAAPAGTSRVMVFLMVVNGLLASTILFAGAMGFLWLGVSPLVAGAVAEMFGPRVDIRDVRDINMADILGRKPIEWQTNSGVWGEVATWARTSDSGT